MPFNTVIHRRAVMTLQKLLRCLACQKDERGFSGGYFPTGDPLKIGLNIGLFER